MKHKEDKDIEQMESLLRGTTFEGQINGSHKARLWEQISSPSRTATTSRKDLAIAAAAVFLALGIYFVFPHLPRAVVGPVEVGSGSKAVVDMERGIRYTSGKQTVRITLEDNSALYFLPDSQFTVLSTNTNRKTEDSVVFMEHGTVEASVRRSLPQDLIVRTPDVEVKAIGTRFRVRVEKTN